MSDEIRVNGNLHSWGSIVLKIDDENFYGFSKIAYGDSRERSKAYGLGRHHAPRGRTRGKYATDPVQLTGSKSTVQALREALAAASDSETSYGDVVCEIVVQYVEEDDTPITVVLEECVWTKNTSSDEEGPDALNDDVEFDCMRIRRNGVVLFSEAAG